MATQTAAHAFAHQLRAVMTERGYSVRALGKAVDPHEPERGRRKVQRSLSGKHMPNDATRRSYADALSAPALAEPAEDDEESDQPMRDFMAAIGVLVDRLVEKRMAQREAARA